MHNTLTHGEPILFAKVAKALHPHSDTCQIFNMHVKWNFTKWEQFPLKLLLLPENLKSSHQSGRLPALSKEEKDHLIATIKKDWASCHMSLSEIQSAAGFSHLSTQTVLNAIHDWGLKAYYESCRFILEDKYMVWRVKFFAKRKDWKVEKEWANWVFTDEMCIEVGAFYGISLIWREKMKNERKTVWV